MTCLTVIVIKYAYTFHNGGNSTAGPGITISLNERGLSIMKDLFFDSLKKVDK